MMEKEIKENNFKVKIISFSVDSFDLIINEWNEWRTNWARRRGRQQRWWWWCVLRMDIFDLWPISVWRFRWKMIFTIFLLLFASWAPPQTVNTPAPRDHNPVQAICGIYTHLADVYSPIQIINKINKNSKYLVLIDLYYYYLSIRINIFLLFSLSCFVFFILWRLLHLFEKRNNREIISEGIQLKLFCVSFEHMLVRSSLSPELEATPLFSIEIPAAFVFGCAFSKAFLFPSN